MQSSNCDEISIWIDTPRGRTRVCLSVPNRPMRMSDIVPLAQRFTDIQVEQAIAQEEAAGRSLTCRAGCGACCRQLVPISAPEAFLLADHVASLPPDQRDDSIARFGRLVEELRVRAAMPALQILARDYKQTDLKKVAENYFSYGLPCPLLLDESCSVYDVRPISCRDYNVTSPAEWCIHPTEHTINKIPTPSGMSFALARLAAKLTGNAPELITLGLALDWAEDHAPLAFEEWPGRDLIRGFLDELKQLPWPFQADESMQIEEDKN